MARRRAVVAVTIAMARTTVMAVAATVAVDVDKGDAMEAARTGQAGKQKEEIFHVALLSIRRSACTRRWTGRQGGVASMLRR
jgi:hypothetical protein